MIALLPWPSFGLMITSTAPPVPLPIFAELLNPESENTVSKLTVPKVYPAPPEWIVVSVPVVNPNDAREPDVTVIRMIAPDEVPWLVPSPKTAA